MEYNKLISKYTNLDSIPVGAEYEIDVYTKAGKYAQTIMLSPEEFAYDLPAIAALIEYKGCTICSGGIKYEDPDLYYSPGDIIMELIMDYVAYDKFDEDEEPELEKVKVSITVGDISYKLNIKNRKELIWAEILYQNAEDNMNKHFWDFL